MRSVDVDEPWPELVRRAQDGDERAFAVIWRRHQPGLVRYLEIVAGRQAAEDLASETWISVIRALPRFRGREPGFKALLYTTARSRVVDGARRAKARPQRAHYVDDVDDVDDVDGLGVAGADDVAAGVEQAEATRAALALIARLPAGQAEVVALRVIGGLDNREVAQITGKRSGAVRVAHSRGLAALARMAAEPGGVTDPDQRAFR